MLQRGVSIRLVYEMDGSEVARRVGVPVAFVEQLVKLGVLEPDDQGSFSQGYVTRLVGAGSHSFRDLGTIELKGIERPVHVHQPVAPGA